MDNKYNFKMRVNSFELDINRNQKVSYLLRHMQEAGGLHLDSSGLTYDALREMEMVFVLIKLAVNINKPLIYGMNIDGTTWSRGAKGVIWRRDFNFSADGVNIAEACSEWVLMNFNSRKVLRPSAFTHNLSLCEDEQNAQVLQSFSMTDNAELVGERRIAYSDVDANQHLNNAVYADIMCDFIPGGMENRTLKYIAVNYINECKEGDIIKIYSARDPDSDGNSFLFLGEADGKRRFEGKIILNP